MDATRVHQVTSANRAEGDHSVRLLRVDEARCLHVALNQAGGPLDSISRKAGPPKPGEVRMGNGKGNPEFWVSEIKPGAVLYEMDGVTEPEAREALRLAASKLPLRTTFVSRLVGG